MCKKLTYLVFVLTIGLTSSVEAATIIWVSHNKTPVDGIPADQGFVDLLRAQGYDVDHDVNRKWQGLNDAELAELNAADVIIISRDNNVGTYATDEEELTQWNGVETPLILLDGRIARADSWRWVDTTANNNTLPTLEGVVPDHFIFTGVTLNASNQVDILTVSSSFPNTTDPGNGTLIGKRSNNDRVWVIEWQTGQEFYIGSGQYAGAPRMLFAAGEQDIDGRYNLNAQGERMFLNAVHYMLPEPERAKAWLPGPGHAAVIGETYMFLGWEPGDTAVSHDVYFSDNFDEVYNRTAAKATVSDAMHFVSDLVRGTTYYWAVDERDAGNNVYRGDLWRFFVQPLKAYDPSPSDGRKYLATPVTLAWSAGEGAIAHDVYLGEDFDAVNNATTSSPEFQGKNIGTDQTTYPLVGLTNDTDYYWRIDEIGAATYKGDVWHFMTMPDIPITDPNLVGRWTFDEGEGDAALDWSGHGNHGTIRGEPNWVVPGWIGDAALSFDGASNYVAIQNLHYSDVNLPEVTVCAWIRTTESGTQRIVSFDRDEYWRLEINGDGGGAGQVGWDVMTLEDANQANEQQVDLGSITRVDDGEWHHVAGIFDNGTLRIYIDGRLDAWISADSTFGTGVARYGFIGCSSEATSFDGTKGIPNHFNGDLDDVRIYDKALTQAGVKEAMRGDPLLAWNPKPAHVSTPDIEHATPLNWSPGDNADMHDVYLGTDRDAVYGADASDTTGIYRGRQDPNEYTPPTALEYTQTYYWRIDEYNADTTISKGRIWSFTVADYLVVDDFESYDDFCNRIFYTWPDGWGYSGDPGCGVDPFGGNGSGSTVGYLDAPYAEQTIVQSGRQSMPFEYLNDGSTGQALYSETERVFDPPQDWTRKDVKSLTLWFRGYAQSFSTFAEGPAGTYTMTARCGDIAGTSDQFHYVFKRLSGVGSIQAKVLSVDDTADGAKAGVMIRDTLDPDSAYAAALFQHNGEYRFSRRLEAGGGTTSPDPGDPCSAPHWVKVEFGVGNMVNAYHSTDGSDWWAFADNPQIIPMSANAYIGLVLCSDNVNGTCVAHFSDVVTTGTTGEWQSEDVGITSNTGDQLYVAVEDSTATTKVVEHEDPDAVLLNTWQEWNIPLSEFGDAGVNLQSISKMYVGVGDRDAPTLGGAGTLYIDNIRIYRPRCIADLARPAADFSNNCLVDYPDLDILGDNWLTSEYEVTPQAVSPADPCLVAHYKFDGNASDSSGNGNDGTEMWGPAYVAGMDNQAIRLDGLDDYVAIQGLNYATEGHRQVTVCAWIRTSQSHEQTIAAFDRNEYWRLDIGGDTLDDGQLGWKVMTISMGAGEQVDLGSSTLVDDGQWHHVAGTFDNGALTIYIDGNRESSASGGSTFGTGNTRYGFVGQRSEAEGFDGDTGVPWRFDGELDDVRIYSRALSQAELASLAGRTTAYTQPLYLLLSPADPAINMVADNIVNLKDYALIVDSWLDEVLWP